MKMEEENNRQSTGAGKVKQKVDNAKNKVKKIKKIIDFLRKNPIIAKILFWVILILLIIVIFTCILYVVGLADNDEASSSVGNLKEAIKSLNLPSDGSGSSTEGNVNYIESGAFIEGNKYILK